MKIMADRNSYRRQEHREQSERGDRQGRQPEQFQSERSYREEEYGGGYGQMGEDYSEGRSNSQQNEQGNQDERYGSSWRSEGSFEGGRDQDTRPGGGYGPARYDNRERGGLGSFNSESYRTGGDVGPRENQGYGRGQSTSGGSYGTGTHGVAGQRDHTDRGGSQRSDNRGFFDKAGDEVASWFGDDDAARRREKDHRGRGPANYTRSDDRILEDACDRLTEDGEVDARNIQVTVQGGELTLDGTVEDRRHKRRAEDVVHDISGVGHVQNNLRMTGNVRSDHDRTDTDEPTTSERNTGTLA